LLHVVLATLALLLLSVVAFRFINPPITPVMLVEKLKGETLRRDWVPLENMSTSLPLAVIASEDGRFCLHWGVDWGAVKEAIQEGDGFADFRGASTITMQTVKNIYLWNGRSYIRKLMEVPLAYLLTVLWPKERVMEVYLNIAQWGPGIFGAEAASRYHFRKSAAQLTRREAVLLAVALPNPRLRNPARPSARMLVIARAVERRMPIIAGRSGCVLPAR
jgi:monofunctional biosynthetic peptidoglycan transglycosylase